MLLKQNRGCQQLKIGDEVVNADGTVRGVIFKERWWPESREPEVRVTLEQNKQIQKILCRNKS